MEKNYHPYHMVNMSPWPLYMGLISLVFMIGMLNSFLMSWMMVFYSLIFLLMVMMMWWRDVIRESSFQGNHSSYVLNGLVLGMIMFILSEVFFFLSFFWTFFHSSLNVTFELGMEWPPIGIQGMNPFMVPLLNTIVLLSSGVSITFCHQSMLNNDWVLSENSLMMTWIMGLYFLSLQVYEYYMSSYMISDSVYGSVFFMSTGFHGFHVILGSVFLMTMWWRMKNYHFSFAHHIGFEAAAWYWHFVDVVWLFLFSVVYWWGM